jgi:hypothetical protein
MTYEIEGATYQRIRGAMGTQGWCTRCAFHSRRHSTCPQEVHIPGIPSCVDRENDGIVYWYRWEKCNEINDESCD